MRRLISALLFLTALVALTAPSLAAVEPVAIVPADCSVSTTAADMSAAIDHIYRPCKQQGGKSVLPCHFDQAILRDLATGLAWPGTPDWALAQTRIHRPGTSWIELPPPRLS